MHQDFVALSGTETAQCVRLVTLSTDAHPPHLVHGWVKIVVGDNLIDNFWNGETGNY